MTLFTALTLTFIGCALPAPIMPPLDQTAKAPEPAAPGSGAAVLPLMAEVFPQTGGPCWLIGENDLTRDFLDDAGDLVGCPVTIDSQAFMHATGALIVAQVGDIQLFRLPRR